MLLYNRFAPRFSRLLFISVFLTLCVFLQKAGIADDTTLTNEQITVGLKETPPFVIENNGVYGGVSVDLWKNIASNLGVDYEFKEYDELTEILQALDEGEVDICVSPLTVTSDRLQNFNFTQPFYITNLAITTSQTNRHYLIEFITNFFSLDFLKAVLLLFLVIAVFGFLVWLAERKQNPAMFASGIKGVGHGIWWSAVTMTTVGYGDKAPVTITGRILTMIWMFTSIIIVSGFTASIASSLTVTQLGADIDGLRDLRRLQVGTVEGSSAQSYLNSQSVPVRKFQKLTKGLEAVKSGELDAFFYDKPIIKYQIFNKPALSETLQVLPNTFNTQYYSYAVPEGSPLLNELNLALIQELESVRWKAVRNEYNLEQ